MSRGSRSFGRITKLVARLGVLGALAGSGSVGAGSAGRDRSAGGRRRTGGDPTERRHQAVHLGGRVVVGQADPDDATALEEAEPLDQAGRVEVAVPDGDPLGA